MSKTAKLLRLCGSPNDHEALTALRMLQRSVGNWNEFVASLRLEGKSTEQEPRPFSVKKKAAPENKAEKKVKKFGSLGKQIFETEAAYRKRAVKKDRVSKNRARWGKSTSLGK